MYRAPAASSVEVWEIYKLHLCIQMSKKKNTTLVVYLVELCTYRTLNIWNVTIKPRHIWFCCLLLWLRGGSQRAREKVGNPTKQNHWQWALKTSTPMIPRCLWYFNVWLPQCLPWKNAGLWTHVLMIPCPYLGESLSARWRQCNIQSNYFNTTFLVVNQVFLCCGMSSCYAMSRFYIFPV